LIIRIQGQIYRESRAWSTVAGAAARKHQPDVFGSAVKLFRGLSGIPSQRKELAFITGGTRDTIVKVREIGAVRSRQIGEVDDETGVNNLLDIGVYTTTSC